MAGVSALGSGDQIFLDLVVAGFHDKSGYYSGA
jgi:hypothetical protein